MREEGDLRIVVVGNCCSGKTTLVEQLQQLGYQAINCPQEHTTNRQLWQKHRPHLVIGLKCSLVVAKQRRNISWGEKRLQKQRQILSHAYDHADAIIDTDHLSIKEMTTRAVDVINAYLTKNS